MLQIYNIHFYNSFKMPESGIFLWERTMSTPFKMERGVKYRDAAKTSIIPVKNIDPNQELLKSRNG